MTINAKMSELAQSALRFLTAAFCILLSWFGAMIVLMIVLDISSKAIVFGDAKQIFLTMSEETKLTRTTNNSFIVTSAEAGYVRNLYNSGAWLVLPSLRSGCLDLTPKQISSTLN